MKRHAFVLFLLGLTCAGLAACDKKQGKDDTGSPSADADGDGYPASEDCDDADPSVHETLDYHADADSDGYGDASTALASCAVPVGMVLDASDCDDANALVHPGVDELCDGRDNNCDGSTDGEDAVGALPYHTDADGDGFGDPESVVYACEPPPGTTADDNDCDDADPDIYPRARETCNGEDDDCDGAIDNSPIDAMSWYPDADGDGYGDEDAARTQACDAPVGMVSDRTDCDDDNPAVNPSATEIVADGIDQDCSGGETCYTDYDRDGYGGTGTRLSVDMDCLDARESSVSTDCSDTDASVHPGAAETCNSRDDDCDGETDEDAVDMASYYRDADGDRYGDPSVTSFGCRAPTGYVTNGSDCDDTDASVGLPVTWYPDRDGDGYGDSAGAVSTCEEPEGYLRSGGDCNDASDQANPGMTEICGDGLDNDCDADPSECSVSGTASLSLASATWFGEDTRDAAGASMAGAGDLDGDGYAELLVGASGRASSAGAVYLVGGPVSGTRDLSLADLVLEGETAGDQAGASVLALDDFDGDGAPDLLVGAPGQDAGGANAGLVYVWSASLSGRHALGDAGLLLLGDRARDEAGTSLASAGDIDGDGALDLLVGAPGHDASASDAGAVWLVHGPLTSSATLGEAGILLAGEAASDHAGFALAGGQDLDGDGRSDLAIGVPDQGVANRGRVYVVFGPVGADLGLGASDAILTGASAGDQLGWSVALGDANDDGYADLLVGVPYEDGGGSNAGAARLFLGPFAGSLSPSDADAAFIGEDDLDSAGIAVAFANLDASGPDDLLIGAHLEGSAASGAGAVYILFGPVSGEIDLSRANAKRRGVAADDQAGRVLASPGDVNGDGYDDMLVGAQGHDAGGSGAGAVFLLIGGLGP